jgi:TolA protein
VHELAEAEPLHATGATGGAKCRSTPPELIHVLGGLSLPRAEPWRRRMRAFFCASLSVLLHGSALAAMLMISDHHTELGAITVPSQAISVELVSSSVLESMQQTETNAEAAEAADSSKAGAEPIEASKKASKEDPPEKEPIEEATQDGGKVASAETEIREAAPRKSNETEREMPKPLTDEPAPILKPEPKVTTPQPSESDGEKEAAWAREMAEQARKEAQQHEERIEHEARERREREDERRRTERKREAERKEEERKEQQRKKVDKGGATSKGAAAAANQSGRVSASAGSILTYASQVRARVASHKPSGAGERGTAMVAFGVTTSGGLSYASISRSSGSAALDRLAIAAVRGAAPFSQPPAGASPSQLRFTIPFHFQ